MANPFKSTENRAKGNPIVENLGLHEEPEIVEKPAAENLLAGMKDKKPKAKSYGFYLEDDVVEALERLAAQNDSSKSKVLNTLLRNLLLNK